MISLSFFPHPRIPFRPRKMKHIVAILSLWNSLTFATPHKGSQTNLLSRQKETLPQDGIRVNTPRLRARGTSSLRSRAGKDGTISRESSQAASSKDPPPTGKRQATQSPDFEHNLSSTRSQTQRPAAKRRKTAKLGKTGISQEKSYQGPPIFKPAVPDHPMRTRRTTDTLEVTERLQAEERQYRRLMQARIGRIPEDQSSKHRDMVKKLGISIRPCAGGIPGQYASEIRKMGQAYHPASIYRFVPQGQPRPSSPIPL